MIKGGVPSEFLDEVRSKCDIVDIASRYMTLNRRGSNFWACCPFHNEKTPSFSIKSDGQFYKCFGCGESGNVFNLVMKLENVDFLSAVEMLAKQVGLEMPSKLDTDEMQKRKRERERVYLVLKATTEFYHNNLISNPNSEQAKYLATRGISEEMIEKFMIGASLDYDSLPKHLSKLGFYPNEMISAGVVGRDDYNRLYDFYGKRLIFPICNGLGDVVAYSGRAIEASPQHTKYKNTPQTIVFNKSEILFAYNFVRDLKKTNFLDTIIIVEGHIDVIACHQAGITNTIGCMGTALTSLHAKKIKQLADNVILCLDGDNAGASATYKALDTLKEVGLNVRVVRLMGAKDPDEYLKKYGKDNFYNELGSAKDCVDFVIHDRLIGVDLKDNAKKSKYVGEMLDYISKFSSPAEQDIYLNELNKIVHIPVDVLRKSMNSSGVEVIKNTSADYIQDTAKDNYILESKLMLLASMLYKKPIDYKAIAPLFGGEDELSTLYLFIASKLDNNEDFAVATLFDNFDIEDKSLLDRVINYTFPADNVFEQYLNDTIARVRVMLKERERDKIKSKMLSATTEEERYELLNKLQEITNEINKEKK